MHMPIIICIIALNDASHDINWLHHTESSSQNMVKMLLITHQALGLGQFLLLMLQLLHVMLTVTILQIHVQDSK